MSNEIGIYAPAGSSVVESNTTVINYGFPYTATVNQKINMVRGEFQAGYTDGSSTYRISLVRVDTGEVVAIVDDTATYAGGRKLEETVVDWPLTAGLEYVLAVSETGDGTVIAGATDTDNSNSTRATSSANPIALGTILTPDGYTGSSAPSLGGDVVTSATGPDYTARKGATGVEITHTLTADGITSQTLGGEVVTLVSQSGQVVTLDFDESAITTSDVYDIVLGDGVDTQTFKVQYNVIGLPSNTLLKDGAALASLADVKLTVLDASGTRLDRQTGLTTDADGLTGVTPVAAGAVDDPVEVSFFSPGSEVGIVYETTLGLL
jgi:hypothetical protein